MQYDDVITNPRWRTDAILKIVFWLYLGAILADQYEIWNRNEGSHADIGHVTKSAIYKQLATDYTQMSYQRQQRHLLGYEFEPEP